MIKSREKDSRLFSSSFHPPIKWPWCSFPPVKSNCSVYVCVCVCCVKDEGRLCVCVRACLIMGFCVRKRECVCVSKTDKICVCNGGFVCKGKGVCVCVWLSVL